MVYQPKWFFWGANENAQSGLSGGSTFEIVKRAGNLDVSSNIVTLPAGFYYKIKGTIANANPTNSSYSLIWLYNETLGKYIGEATSPEYGNYGELNSLDFGSNWSTQPQTFAVIYADVDTQISLKLYSISTGTLSIDATYGARLMIESLPDPDAAYTHDKGTSNQPYQWLYCYKESNQSGTPISAGTLITMTKVFGNLDVSSSLVALKKNHTYLCEAGVATINNATNAVLSWRWYNENSSAYFGNLSQTVGAGYSFINNTGTPLTGGIITPTVDLNVSLRVEFNSNCTIVGQSFYAFIESWS